MLGLWLWKKQMEYGILTLETGKAKANILIFKDIPSMLQASPLEECLQTFTKEDMFLLIGQEKMQPCVLN